MLAFAFKTLMTVSLVAMVTPTADAGLYTVTGEFGADSLSGPASGLAFGSFSGTFTTTLPSSSSENFSNYDVKLFDATGKLFTEITSSNSIDHGFYTPNVANVGRDVIDLYNDPYFLQFSLPLNFSGSGPITPTAANLYPSFLEGPINNVTISSGFITSVVPEPSSIALCCVGLAILALRVQWSHDTKSRVSSRLRALRDER